MKGRKRRGRCMKSEEVGKKVGKKEIIKEK